MIMKKMKISIISNLAIIGMLSICSVSCKQEIISEVDCKITLDPENTYYAGEPVKFNVDGQIDNLLFYSGEIGSQYKNKDRFTVPIEDVKKAALTLDYQARYGVAGALEVYITNDFEGLKGNDGTYDRKLMDSLYRKGMPGWEKLEYNEGASTRWTTQTYDVSKYIDNIVLAFHWNVASYTQTQRTYWIKGKIELDMEGTQPVNMSIRDLGFQHVAMNADVDAYKKNAGNGSLILNKPETADVIFQGIGANNLTYALNAWVITKPSPLNKVSNDKGVVIKNQINYMDSFTYTWDEPGNYTVNIVGVNSNIGGSYKEVYEYNVTILDKVSK